VQFPPATHPVLGFTSEADARRVLAVLPKRYGKYGLTLHPEKTRLIDFCRPHGGGSDKLTTSGGGRTFDLLGFTHYWARSRKGHWVIKQKTAKARLSRAITRIGQWCQWHRHTPVPEQHRALSQQLRGHYGYYGVTGNSRALGRMLSEVQRRWRYWLNRRSDRGGWTWERFRRYLGAHPLPPPVPIHSTYRLAARP
jgi:RNA-directed DNA polymerase